MQSSTIIFKSRILSSYLLIIIIPLTFVSFSTCMDPEHNTIQNDFLLEKNIESWMPSLKEFDLLKYQLLEKYISEDINTRSGIICNDRFFGYTTTKLHTIRLKTLQYTKQCFSEKNNLTFMECGAGTNPLIFYVALIAGLQKNSSTTLIINELSPTALKKAENLLVNRLKECDISTNNLIFHQGNCLSLRNILGKSVHNQVDVLSVQNVEHFFNPEEHQIFVHKADYWLVKGGRIFCTALTIPPECYESNEFMELYNHNKTHSLYPAFVKYTFDMGRIMETETIVKKMVSASQAKPYELTYTNTDSVLPEEFIDFGASLNSIIRYQILRNYFTADIYKNIYCSIKNDFHPQFSCVDIFYMDENGNRYSTEKYDPNVHIFISAIFEKC